MQKAVLLVLTGHLCVQGGIADLPHDISIPRGFDGFIKYLVKNSLCGVWSSMHISTLTELLRRLLPVQTLDGFLYIVGCNNPTTSQPYPNHAQLLKVLLKSYRQCRFLMNKTIRIVEIDPLNWRHLRLLKPSISVTNDVECPKVQGPYYVVKELLVGGFNDLQLG